MEKCSFAWTKNQKTPALHSVSLRVVSGSIVGVAGAIGTGKSALLAAILGDMHCIRGVMKVNGRIAYVPQVACLFNMTVRENIVFGSQFDPMRYGRVLEACELVQDIRTLPAGDMTQVSEKGETLSGGQKQRIALARAAYSRSEVYLFDDPLSALDTKVSGRVFDNVLGRNGMLRNKTRILVTNNSNLLRNMDQLLLVHDRTVSSYRDAKELVARQSRSSHIQHERVHLRSDSAPELSMLSHVLSSPVPFFDANSRGRILNRFSVDLDAVDIKLYLFGKQFIQATLLTVARLTVAGCQAPGIMIVGSTALIALVIGMWVVLRAANAARFVETSRMSRVLQHVTESVESLSILRSYGVVERFCSHFCRLTDFHLEAYATYCACYRLTRTLGNVFGLTIVLTSILTTLWRSYGTSSSEFGLALSVSLSVGVVGRTGAGKSSLVLALLRVLKPTSGNICIDGIDIRKVPLRRLRTSLTVIPQDPSLVRGSLRNNLDPTEMHSDDDLWRVLEQAHLAEFVLAHQDKLLMETGDGGSNLSVGQRQLVCLARALLRRPKVLILDEATSQMDSDTDRLVQATLRSNFASCTVLTVAHRIHTILDYDMVLVMADGEVQEFGPVNRLLADPNSIFRNMASSDGVDHKLLRT
ncbi:putative ABC transporter [Ixodes scapularis]